MGSRCATLANLSPGSPETRWVGESAVRQRRVGLLEREELAHEPVVLGVGEDRVVEDVVGVVRLADPRPELLDALRRAVGHARSVTRGAGAAATGVGGQKMRVRTSPGSAASTKAFPYPL